MSGEADCSPEWGDAVVLVQVIEIDCGAVGVRSALKGQTPREAATSSAGRERLEALLAEFELKGGAPVARLRAELGL